MNTSNPVAGNEMILTLMAALCDSADALKGAAYAAHSFVGNNQYDLEQYKAKAEIASNGSARYMEAVYRMKNPYDLTDIEYLTLLSSCFPIERLIHPEVTHEARRDLELIVNDYHGLLRFRKKDSETISELRSKVSSLEEQVNSPREAIDQLEKDIEMFKTSLVRVQETSNERAVELDSLRVKNHNQMESIMSLQAEANEKEEYINKLLEFIDQTCLADKSQIPFRKI